MITFKIIKVNIIMVITYYKYWIIFNFQDIGNEYMSKWVLSSLLVINSDNLYYYLLLITY